MPRYLSIADSNGAAAENAQHEAIVPWFLTGVTQFQSRKSNLEGNVLTSIEFSINSIFAPGISTIVS